MSGASGAIAVESDRVWYYMDANSKQQGPITPSDMADLLIDRDINSKTYGWRSGLADWVPLSSLPELKGIFAIAFDAPDEAAGAAAAAGTNNKARGNAARNPNAAANQPASGNGSNSASAQPSAPTDPLAIWYYLDKSRAQQGPVRAEQIVRLYGLMQLSDASLVYDATHKHGSAWVRLSEVEEISRQLGADVLASYEKEREELRLAEEKRLADKKRKREKQKAGGGGGGFKASTNSTAVYVTGLPLDTTIDEIYDVFRRGGIIAEDDLGNKKVKLYAEADGKLKGDALVTYAMADSVELAITLLDQAVFRPKKFETPAPSKSNNGANNSTSSSSAIENKDYVVTVQKATFERKVDKDSQAQSSASSDTSSAAATAATDSNSSKKPRTDNNNDKQSKGLHSAEIHRQKLRDSLSWSDEPESSSKLKILIMQPLFTVEEAHAAAKEALAAGEVHSEAEGHTRFYSELKSEITNEIEDKIGGGSAGLAQRGGRGCLEKLTVFENNPQGVIAAKFRSSVDAAKTMKLFQGRLFGGKKIKAFYFDGKTNYVVAKPVAPGMTAEEEEERRLKEFGDWIESGGGDEDVHVPAAASSAPKPFQPQRVHKKQEQDLDVMIEDEELDDETTR